MKKLLLLMITGLVLASCSRESSVENRIIAEGATYLTVSFKGLQSGAVYPKASVGVGVPAYDGVIEDLYAVILNKNKTAIEAVVPMAVGGINGFTAVVPETISGERDVYFVTQGSKLSATLVKGMTVEEFMALVTDNSDLESDGVEGVQRAFAMVNLTAETITFSGIPVNTAGNKLSRSVARLQFNYTHTTADIENIRIEGTAKQGGLFKRVTTSDNHVVEHQPVDLGTVHNTAYYYVYPTDENMTISVTVLGNTKSLTIPNTAGNKSYTINILHYEKLEPTDFDLNLEVEEWGEENHEIDFTSIIPFVSAIADVYSEQGAVYDALNSRLDLNYYALGEIGSIGIDADYSIVVESNGWLTAESAPETRLAGAVVKYNLMAAYNAQESTNGNIDEALLKLYKKGELVQTVTISRPNDQEQEYVYFNGQWVSKYPLVNDLEDKSQWLTSKNLPYALNNGESLYDYYKRLSFSQMMEFMHVWSTPYGVPTALKLQNVGGKVRFAPIDNPTGYVASDRAWDETKTPQGYDIFKFDGLLDAEISLPDQDETPKPLNDSISFTRFAAMSYQSVGGVSVMLMRNVYKFYYNDDPTREWVWCSVGSNSNDAAQSYTGDAILAGKGGYVWPVDITTLKIPQTYNPTFIKRPATIYLTKKMVGVRSYTPNK